MQAPTDRLVAETLAKSGLIWVSSPAGSTPVWHVVVDDVAYVVSGPGEQFCPPHEGRARVVTRAKETRERLADFDADVSVVSPQDDDWERAAEALRAARLNAPDEDVVARWRESGVVLRLRPDLTSVVVRGEKLPAPPVNEARDDVENGHTVENGHATGGRHPRLRLRSARSLTDPRSTAPSSPPRRGPGGTCRAACLRYRGRRHDGRRDGGAAATATAGPPVSSRLGSGDDGGAAKVSP